MAPVTLVTHPDTLIDTLADTVASVTTVVKPDTVTDTLMDSLTIFKQAGNWIGDNLGLFLTIVFGVLGVVGLILAIVFYRRGKKSGDKAFKELKEEINILKKGQQNMSLYLNGLPEVRDKKKAILLRDAFRAMREYKHEKAIKKFREAYPLTSDPSERCAILSLIGLSQGKSGATQDAEMTYLEVTKIAEQAKIEDALAIAYGNIGVVYYIQGEFRKALDYFEQALKINDKIGSLEGQASQLGNIGNIHHSLGKFRKALEYYQKSLRVAEQIENFQIQAQMFGNIGIIYATQGETQKALGYQQRALELAKKIGNEEIRAKSLGNIGIVYQNLGEPHKVFDYLKEALEINEKIGNLEGQAEGLANIGTAYGNMGDHQQALDYFQRARALYMKIGARDKVELCDRNIAVAKEAMKK